MHACIWHRTYLKHSIHNTSYHVHLHSHTVLCVACTLHYITLHTLHTCVPVSWTPFMTVSTAPERMIQCGRTYFCSSYFRQEFVEQHGDGCAHSCLIVNSEQLVKTFTQAGIRFTPVFLKVLFFHHFFFSFSSTIFLIKSLETNSMCNSIYLLMILLLFQKRQTHFHLHHRYQQVSLLHYLRSMNFDEKRIFHFTDKSQHTCDCLVWIIAHCTLHWNLVR